MANRHIKWFCGALLSFLLSGCATLHRQQGWKLGHAVSVDTPLSPVHTFFLVGNTGGIDNHTGRQTLRHLENRRAQTEGNSTLLFPNDKTYPGPLEKLDIGAEISLIVIDSEWYIRNYPFRGREAFFDELGRLLDQSRYKLTLVAIHHPLVTNGRYGGYYRYPGVGTLANLPRKTAGINPNDVQHPPYRELINRLGALIKGRDNVLLLSGHEHSLQYIEKDGLKQVISGSASKVTAARAVQPVSFTAGVPGYGVLEVYEEGGTRLSFYNTASETDRLIFRREVVEIPKAEIPDFPEDMESYTAASVYQPEDTRKRFLYRLFFGEHYRKYYGRSTVVKTLLLDTDYGGLAPLMPEGSRQAVSLRVENPDGKQYVLHPAAKSATRFLQRGFFRDQYVERDFEGTYTEDFVRDLYTIYHPFAPYILDMLAQSIGLPHTNPRLYYVPRQKALGKYNADFGDGLYMLEEYPSEGYVSTDEMLANLRKGKKYTVDREAYLNARLFDMLIGDWDHRIEQWRWGKFEEGGRMVYRPVPRDRSQAFTRMDGALSFLLKNLPPLRHTRSYKRRFAHTRWFNRTAFPLDILLLQGTSEEEWALQAGFITRQLTDERIDAAFQKLPREVRDRTSERLKRILKVRRNTLIKHAGAYHRTLKKTARKISNNHNRLDEYILDAPPVSYTTLFPLVGFNPDDGVKVGLSVAWNRKDFVPSPFSERHQIRAEHYFATSGFELAYNGQMPFAKSRWGVALDARATSSNFAINYFGYGNETRNPQDVEGMDYNRVRLQQYGITPSLRRLGKFGSLVEVGVSIERIEVEPTEGRFISEPDVVDTEVFSARQFAGLHLAYSYQNYDVVSRPTTGMAFGLSGGWKMNTGNGRAFPWAEGKLNLTLPLGWEDRVVLSTTSMGRVLFNNNFEFYQGAALGGDDNLRGYRTERFLGNSYFLQRTDLRFNLGQTGEYIAPMNYGVLGGFDHGRVWLDGERSGKWHSSVGAGMWLNALNMATAHLSYFLGSDLGRFVFGLNFGF